MVTIRKISTAKNRLKTGKGSDGRNFILYYSDEIDPKALLVYIHGGGLLYGTPEDLPKMHVEKFTSSGYAILAIDYPLAPQAKIDAILEDIVDSINKSFKAADLADSLPLFVWGRSAGAYLALLSSVNDKLTVKLNGIISYYGYGFLNDGWYDAPSAFYSHLPAVPAEMAKTDRKEAIYSGALDEYYRTYVYTRQTGKWKDLIYEGRDKFFFLYYTLRTVDSLPTPLFAAHSTGDTDVPYSEFISLCNKYKPEKFIVSIHAHDFDRNTDDPATKDLLSKTSDFIENNL